MDFDVVIDDECQLSRANHHMIGRSSDGKLWLAYIKPTGDWGDYQLASASSVDDGWTWAEKEIIDVGDVFTEKYDMVVDSSGIPHVVFSSREGSQWRIYHIYKDPDTGWTDRELLVSGGTSQLWYPTLALDSSDDLHLLYCTDLNVTGNYLYYKKRTAGSWGADETVAHIAAPGLQGEPAIAVDLSGVIHVFWRGRGTAGAANPDVYNILYRQKTGGGWQSIEMVTDMANAADHQLDPCVVLDSDDDIYAAWTGDGWGVNTGYRNIQFRKRESGAWQTQEAVTDMASDQTSTRLSMDRSSNIHCVWCSTAGGDDIEHRERSSGGVWGEQEELVDYHISYNILPLSLLWANHPGQNNILVSDYRMIYRDIQAMRFYAPPITYHYIIYNVDDLQAMEDDLTGHYELANDIDASATIGWNGGAGFLPIGQAANFIGQLDGKGYTISGLFINRAGVFNQALFDTIDESAVLQNIKMTGVDITNTNYFYAAALVATMRGSSIVENCSSAGSVTAAGSGAYAAGLIAFIYSGTVSRCYSTCTVTVSGLQDYAGGLIGYMIDGDIDQCYATGAVTVGDDYAGGFIARANGGTINDCYARGAVTVGDDYGGGFVGRNQGATIEDCYSTGLLAVVDSYEGGFCGYNLGTITNCFWDTETSGISTDPGGGSGGATGKTTAQMKTEATFTDAGWDFTTPIWYINPTINDGYPAFIGVVRRIKGNPNIDQRMFQHVERMDR